MSSPKSAPWSSVHLNILLYLAWQHNGRYRDIERAWNEAVPDAKRSLRAITDRLQSIPKDVRKIGLQKYFEDGPPGRRKSEKPNDGSLVARPNTINTPKMRKILALPAPEISKSVAASTNTPSNVDDEAMPWNVDDHVRFGTKSQASGVVDSQPFQEADATDLKLQKLRETSKRKIEELLTEDGAVEDIHVLPGSPKRRKS